MEPIMAFCGIDCAKCPAREATQKDDWFARRELAAEWTTPDYPVMAEDINCEGCVVVDGQMFIFCRDCQLRRCGISHGVKHCAACSSYPCEIVNRAPAETRQRLEKLRAAAGSSE
jgi:hypothetical protein